MQQHNVVCIQSCLINEHLARENVPDSMCGVRSRLWLGSFPALPFCFPRNVNFNIVSLWTDAVESVCLKKIRQTRLVRARFHWQKQRLQDRIKRPGNFGRSIRARRRFCISKCVPCRRDFPCFLSSAISSPPDQGVRDDRLSLYPTWNTSEDALGATRRNGPPENDVQIARKIWARYLLCRAAAIVPWRTGAGPGVAVQSCC
jgi:hypothetical protein